MQLQWAMFADMVLHALCLFLNSKFHDVSSLEKKNTHPVRLSPVIVSEIHTELTF